MELTASNWHQGMATLDELLSDLAKDGEREGTGTFTLSSEQAWKGLRHSIAAPKLLPVFILRWLYRRLQASQVEIAVLAKGSTLGLTASCHESLTWCGQHPPFLDFSGADLDLTRAVVCAEKLKASSICLEIDTGGERHVARFSCAGEPEWELKESTGRREVCFSTVLAKRIPKGWGSEIEKLFCYSSVPIVWNSKSINRPVSFQYSTAVWRRVLPQNKELGQLSFLPPSNCPIYFVCARHEDTEILMGLSSAGFSRCRLIYCGQLFELQTVGFPTGFEIIINTTSLRLDIQGSSVVLDQLYRKLRREIREESYDMVLQLFRLEPPVEPSILSCAFRGVESAILHLLDEQRYFEGFVLAEWLDRQTSGYRPPRHFQEEYTFLKLTAMLSERAKQHLTARSFSARAKQLVMESGSSDSPFRVEAALIDASLEAKFRRGEEDRLSHHTRSNLHLLGVRERQKGKQEQAFRIFFVLATSLASLTNEHIDVWFDAMELAKSLGKRRALNVLATLFRTSREDGSLKVMRKQLERARELMGESDG